MGHSRGGLTTKIHALVDADGRPVRWISRLVRLPMFLWPKSGWAASSPAQRSLLTQHTTPTLSGTLPCNANAGRVFLQNPIESRYSVSVVGSTVSAISSSGSSTVSSRCVASQRATTGARTTISLASNLQRRGYGLPQLVSWWPDKTTLDRQVAEYGMLVPDKVFGVGCSRGGIGTSPRGETTTLNLACLRDRVEPSKRMFFHWYHRAV